MVKPHVNNPSGGGPHDSRPSRFIGLLPSALSVVEAILLWSRWAYVHDEVPLALIHDCGDMHVTPSPVVGHDAIRAYRISSCNFERPNIRARYSYEKFSGETTFAVKDETTDRYEPCASSVKTVTSVHGCILAMLSVLCLHPDAKAKHNQC